MKRLFELFPKGPAKVAARIAGIPRAPRLRPPGHIIFT
jgi:sulfur relay (sulfurtransferase) DsrC/TusE family protein